MANNERSLGTDGHNLCSDQEWYDLYPFLLQYVRGLLPWCRQKDELVADIVQDTLLRVLLYLQKVERGEAVPIRSIQHFSRRVALHLWQDMRRKDAHFTSTPYDDSVLDAGLLRDFWVDDTEQALENIVRMQLFPVLALYIAEYPDKQRTALLVDIANLTDFAESSLMVQAFSEAGIDLKDYQYALPEDAVERSRHLSLVWHAYKRLRERTALQLRNLDLVA
jgi:DNA-directed RNA polymerase specialized sigma24 family protein